MDEKYIISVINGFLLSASKELACWLERMLPKVSDEWWSECVLSNLTYEQQIRTQESGFTELNQLDLAALLRVADKSWYDMRSFAYLPYSDRECIRSMRKVRNNWAHLGQLEKDFIISDLETILNFFEAVIGTSSYSKDIREFIKNIENANISKIKFDSQTEDVHAAKKRKTEQENSIEIHEMDHVYLVSNPETKGIVSAISEIGGIKKYTVFSDGEDRTFYEGQIVRINPEISPFQWTNLDTFQSNLTAYEIKNPSVENLYSLNAARIDFVPYQFRPALKLIKSDEPRLLIADSVGVGKTIEAGLIIKELEARNELDNVLIICPKPLVSERKWELEMRRFDEEFVPLDGNSLRQIISDTDRDGEWPSRFNKSIIPYSILDGRIYQGDDKKKGKSYGLLDLDPAPHFDLIIIDEAHHIRNGSLEKEKAFAYKCVRYFCEHADAVVMLTATPLQTSDNDLFTLLNLLRPDVIMDKEIFTMMSKPNEYIYRASHIVRGAAEGWEKDALEEMHKISGTQWGENVVSRNPVFSNVVAQLEGDNLTRERRVKLISDIESLHSFNTMLSRTRRKDIQEFCVRRVYTLETQFTPIQRELHDKLLRFEHDSLSRIHNNKAISFMMSTIRRQASSCIYGLAPYVRDLLNRRLDQVVDDPDFDFDDFNMNSRTADILEQLAIQIFQLAESLPDEDPKFDSIVKILEEKQKDENNKVILFSTFRHTLGYLRIRLKNAGLRIAQIDGSVKDDDRRSFHERFELPKTDPNAIDVLLFTEVGSEGLDYQFCNTMINYDIPWNPMRIEQRIGRIDRRGQESEAVNIYNVITSDTVDYDVYFRCLMRINIFERSIGECEEVLGEIGNQIEQIAMDTALTSDERQRKLEQMADNEVRRMQELSRLEDEERSLFGFDLSNYTTAKEISDAESPWISPRNLQKLVERYLSDRLGEGTYIIGNSELKQLRLDRASRMTLLGDFRKLSNIKSGLKRGWENYLKGAEVYHLITFVSEAASQERDAFFITPVHPLVKQAADHFLINNPSYIHIECYADDLPQGQYPFSVYAWSYVGISPRFKVVTVCTDDAVSNELTELLQDASDSKGTVEVNKSTWEDLENKHVVMWMKERASYSRSVRSTADFKLESIHANYQNRKRNLEQKIDESYDEKIKRMYQSELDSATENYQRKVSEINAEVDGVDIHTILLANGIVEIGKE